MRSAQGVMLLAALAVAGCAHSPEFRPHLAMSPPAPHMVVPPVQPAAAPERLLPGEQLTYTVRWLGLAVMRGELRLAPTSAPPSLLEATAVAHSTGLANWIFDVEDHLTSTIDPQTTLPTHFQLTLRHRTRSVTETIEFDRAAARARTVGRATTTASIGPQTRDLLSALYALRTADLVEGHPVLAEMIANGQVCHMIATIHRRGTLTLPQGTFPVLEVDVQASWLEQYVKHQTLRVWITADSTHTPLMVRVRIPVVGAVTAVLDDRRPAWPPAEARRVNVK